MAEATIPAATVLLLRDEPRFEVLMIERHADIAFAGGALVFPGGRIDPGDFNAAWADHAAGLDPDSARAAAQIAAVRETFEETGILLAREAGAAQLLGGDRAFRLGARRKAVEQNDAAFLAIMQEERLVLACDQLRVFAHWIAPPGLHRRFDTLFFFCACPPGQEPQEDGDEATEALFLSPQDVIAARCDGTRKVIFPTIRNIELLARSASVAEVIALASVRRIEPVMPLIIERSGTSYLAIPEGLGYPITEEPVETALRS